MSRKLPAIAGAGAPLPLDVRAAFDGQTADGFAEFILFTEEPGYAAMLEGFRYVDGWPDDVSAFELTPLVREQVFQ